VAYSEGKRYTYRGSTGPEITDSVHVDADGKNTVSTPEEKVLHEIGHILYPDLGGHYRIHVPEFYGNLIELGDNDAINIRTPDSEQRLLDLQRESEGLDEAAIANRDLDSQASRLVDSPDGLTHDFDDPLNGLGPSANAPGRPGHIDHTTKAEELTDTGYIGPATGQPVKSRVVYDEDGPGIALDVMPQSGPAPTPYVSPYAPLTSSPPPQRPTEIVPKDGFGNPVDGVTGWHNSGGNTTYQGSPLDNPYGRDAADNAGYSGGGGSYGGGGGSYGGGGGRDAAEGLRPLILDLDGNGIQITELSKSTVFVDATGDGLQNQTAWAGAGDAVLFYDPDGTGELTEKRQYVFTEWDPTATSDIEALRSVFDMRRML
jgi:hypothetical protein